MQEGLNDMGRFATLHWRGLAQVCGLAVVVGPAWARRQLLEVNQTRKRRMCEETEAYARLDVRVLQGECVRGWGQRICGVVATQSAFYRVAMLMPDVEGGFSIVGSAGMDDLTVRALNSWGRRVIGAECGDGGVGVGRLCFAMVLRLKPEDIGFGRAVVVPIRAAGGEMIAALMVGADGMWSAPRAALDKALLPLEALAGRLGRAQRFCVDDDEAPEVPKVRGESNDFGLYLGGVEMPVEWLAGESVMEKIEAGG